MGDNIFCCNCGKEISKVAKICVGCGVEVGTGEKFCPCCGRERNPLQSVCLGCGIEFKKFLSSINPASPTGKSKDWLVTLLLSYFLGWLGIDRFYLGYTTLGIIKALTCGGCGVWSIIDCILIIFNKIPAKDGSIPIGKEGKEWVGYLFLALMGLGIIIGLVFGVLGNFIRAISLERVI